MAARFCKTLKNKSYTVQWSCFFFFFTSAHSDIQCRTLETLGFVQQKTPRSLPIGEAHGAGRRVLSDWQVQAVHPLAASMQRGTQTKSQLVRPAKWVQRQGEVMRQSGVICSQNVGSAPNVLTVTQSNSIGTLLHFKVNEQLGNSHFRDILFSNEKWKLKSWNAIPRLSFLTARRRKKRNWNGLTELRNLMPLWMTKCRIE